MNLVEASETGDRLDALRELRRQLAQAIDETSSGRDLAALARRLMDVLEQVERIELARQAPRRSVRDEVARKRAERLEELRRGG